MSFEEGDVLWVVVEHHEDDRLVFQPRIVVSAGPKRVVTKTRGPVPNQIAHRVLPPGDRLHPSAYHTHAAALAGYRADLASRRRVAQDRLHYLMRLEYWAEDLARTTTSDGVK